MAYRHAADSDVESGSPRIAVRESEDELWVGCQR